MPRWRSIIGRRVFVAMFILSWSQPIGATEAAAIDPAKDCSPWITVEPKDFQKVSDTIQKSYAQHLVGDRYILCFELKQPNPEQPTPLKLSQTLVITGKDRPLIIYGLDVGKPAFPLPSPSLYFSITGADVTLQHLTLTGPGPQVAGSVGIKLAGTGHQVIDSKVYGFDTGILADCAWPKEAIGTFGPSCTIGPGNTIGEDSDLTGKKLVTIGVRVPTTGQQVTVTQSTIMTVLDKISTDFLADTKRFVLDPGANAGVTPPALVTEPEDKKTLWPEWSVDHTALQNLTGLLADVGAVELFHQASSKKIAIFTQSCAVTQNTRKQWVYTCNDLALPADANAQVKLELLYTRNYNSAPFVKGVVKPGESTDAIAPVGSTFTEGGAVMGGGPGDAAAGGSGLVGAGGGVPTVATADGGGTGSAPWIAPIEESPAGNDDQEVKGETVAMTPGAAGVEGGPLGGIGGGVAKGCSLIIP